MLCKAFLLMCHSASICDHVLSQKCTGVPFCLLHAVIGRHQWMLFYFALLHYGSTCSGDWLHCFQPKVLLVHVTFCVVCNSAVIPWKICSDNRLINDNVFLCDCLRAMALCMINKSDVFGLLCVKWLNSLELLSINEQTVISTVPVQFKSKKPVAKQELTLIKQNIN